MAENSIKLMQNKSNTRETNASIVSLIQKDMFEEEDKRFFTSDQTYEKEVSKDEMLVGSCNITQIDKDETANHGLSQDQARAD